jgi:FkbM family methyltransferase
MKCAIITSVGPGHEQLLKDSCQPSVETAKSYSLGPFESVKHIVKDDTKGLFGRSNRRNEAIREALADGYDWLFFLDADDVMTPNAFEAFGRCIESGPELDAVWGLICEFDGQDEPVLRPGQPEALDGLPELLATEPYLAIQIGAFMRTECVARFGFDESMDTGEDFKLYYQLWENCSCAKRPEIFFINRRGMHSTGPRAATGQDWVKSVNAQWAEQVAKKPMWMTIGPPERAAKMLVNNPNDIIQKAYLRGEFFEADSLEKLHGLINNPAPHILEVGANIGNHVIWYARHLNAERIYPVEPNPMALDILKENVKANNLDGCVDPRGMGFGAGNASGRFRVETDDQDNLGATRLVADEDGEIAVKTLDALMGDDKVDFIKIDAEGMELDVLEGAAGLIARDKPVIWVEVLQKNLLGFAQNWCREAGYQIVDSKPYLNTIDYFAVPRI